MSASKGAVRAEATTWPTSDSAELSADRAQALNGTWISAPGMATAIGSLPHHDAAAIQEALGPVPLAGFFAQGELGPVGGQNFIHGFTASVALFEG